VLGMAAPKKEPEMSPLNAEIPTDLHKRLRIEAINRGATVKALVIEALQKMLGDKTEPPARARVK